MSEREGDLAMVLALLEDTADAMAELSEADRHTARQMSQSLFSTKSLREREPCPRGEVPPDEGLLRILESVEEAEREAQKREDAKHRLLSALEELLG